MRLLLLAALALNLGTLPASAQWLHLPWPGIPRTADGKPNLAAPAPRGPDGKPDLTGVWNGPTPAPTLDPAIAQPWVNDLVHQRQQDYHRERPFYQCLPSGPEADRFAGWKRVVQTPTTIAILNEDLTYRVIFMDGRELEANAAPSWMGYSVGRWDGDALIVDSVGFNDKTWLSRYGQSHTEALRVREVYRRRDFGHLDVEVTFTDPGAYVKPWSFSANMALAPDTELLEAVCERSSDQWIGSTLSDISRTAVTVPPDVLASYVGVYKGEYVGRKRTIEVVLSDGHLVAKVTGAASVDGGDTRPLVAQSHTKSQTLFEGLGMGYQFNVDEKGNVSLTEVHISGLSKFTRQK